MPEATTVQAIAASCSALAALCSLVAAFKSHAVAKSAKEQAARFQKSSGLRELTANVHILRTEAKRALELSESMRSHTLSFAAMSGALGGSAHAQQLAKIERDRAALQVMVETAQAIIDRLSVLSKGTYDEIVDALTRVDANLYAVRLSANDRSNALDKLIDMIREDSKKS